jgi:hypothetical protein
MEHLKAQVELFSGGRSLDMALLLEVDRKRELVVLMTRKNSYQAYLVMRVQDELLNISCDHGPTINGYDCVFRSQVSTLDDSMFPHNPGICSLGIEYRLAGYAFTNWSNV